MTDNDYVAELRSYGGRVTNEAAERIEALTAELAEHADVRKQIDYRLEELVGQVDALTAERDQVYERWNDCQEKRMVATARAEAAHRAMLVAEADNARLLGLIDDVVCGRGMFGLSAEDDLKWAMQHLGSALAQKGDSHE
jgi:septal ring factor EnvC (AmiA/AmiB activator)